MNIKKMMAALACAATVGFSAQAEDTQWFTNAGLADGWPNAAGQEVVWEGATNAEFAAWSAENKRLEISGFGQEGDEKTLTCTAEPRELTGANADSDTASFTAEVGFSAYDMGELPPVPASAKAAITFVATNEETTAGQFYYLAKDAATNNWVESGVYADITGNYAEKVTGVKIAQKKSVAGIWAVTYEIGGKTINAEVNKLDNTTTVSTMEFAGNGPGYVNSIAGYYAEKTYDLTIDEYDLADNKHLCVTNVSVNGVLQGPAASYKVAKDAAVVVYFDAVEGYKLTGDTAYAMGKMTANTTVDSSLENLPDVESADVTMTFYTTGEMPLVEADGFSGTPGTTFGRANEVLEAAAFTENQAWGKWWNGEWHLGDGEPVDFPTEFPEEDGREYYMISTNITYTIYQNFDGGEGGANPTYEINEEEEQEITLEDPTKTGATFAGWEVVGELPDGVTFDDGTFTIESYAIGDINVKATWEEEPTGSMFYIGDTGYDSWEDAFLEAVAGDTIKVGNNDAVIPADTNLDKPITIDLAGKKLSIGKNCKVNEALKVTDTSDAAGSLDIQNALWVSSALDLGDLVFAQTTGCTGGFGLDTDGKVTFPSDVTFPACKTAINSAEVGAKIVVAGATYNKYIDDFGTHAVANVGEDFEYATLDGALADAGKYDTVKLLADITTDATQQWTITEDIILNFDDYKITKTVANDWVFTIADGANVQFHGNEDGGIVHKPAALNQGNPASMIQIIGKLEVWSGTYESDFAIFKTDDVGKKASELVIEGGKFTITAEPKYTGPTYAVMNWCTTLIKGGTFFGDVVARSYQSQRYPSVVTINGGTFGEVGKAVKVGFSQHGEADTTVGTIKVKENIEIVPTIIKGVEGNVVVSTTEENYTVYTLEKAKFDVTFEDGENSTITPAAGTSNLVYGTELTITATADADYMFKTFGQEWTPNAESNVLTQVVTIKAAATFTAPNAEKAAPEPEPVDPSKGGEIPCENPQAATNLAAAITANPSQYVKAPTGLDATSAAIYQSFFKAEVAADGTTVKLMLNETGETYLQGVVDEATDDPDIAAALCDPTAESITYADGTYILGFYYWVAGGTDVKALTTDAKAVQPTAYGDMELDKPALGETTQGFYVIKVDFKDPAK